MGLCRSLTVSKFGHLCTDFPLTYLQRFALSCRRTLRGNIRCKSVSNLKTGLTVYFYYYFSRISISTHAGQINFCPAFACSCDTIFQILFVFVSLGIAVTAITAMRPTKSTKSKANLKNHLAYYNTGACFPRACRQYSFLARA